MFTFRKGSIFLLIISSLSIYPVVHSQILQTRYSQEILTYMSFLDSCSHSDIGRVRCFDRPSKDDIKYAARIIYEAFQSDPINEYMAFDSLHHHWEDSYNNAIKAGKNRDSIPWRPGVVQGEIFSKIEHKLSHRIYAIVISRYLLRVNVFKVIQEDKYVNSHEAIYIPHVNIYAVIKEVLSGQSRYAKGDTIMFYYNSFWRSDGKDFQLGEDCFVPLDALVSPNGELHIGLTTNLDEDIDHPYIDYGSCWSCGRYPVENEILLDRKNTFGLGTNVEWSDFVETIKDEIKKIKSW